MTQQERDRKHAQNRDLAELNRAITKHEDELARLYRARAGRIEWTATGHADHGWCICCGKTHVNPNAGFDTCPTCAASL